MKLRYQPTAFWEYKFSDDDAFEGDHSYSVSIGGFISISYTWTTDSDDEASYAGAWNYDADKVGSDKNSLNPDFEDWTNNYIGVLQFPYEGSDSCYASEMYKSTGSGYASFAKNSQSVSTYAVSTGVAAKLGGDDTWSKARVKFGECKFFIDEVKYMSSP